MLRACSVWLIPVLIGGLVILGLPSPVGAQDTTSRSATELLLQETNVYGSFTVFKEQSKDLVGPTLSGFFTSASGESLSINLDALSGVMELSLARGTVLCRQLKDKNWLIVATTPSGRSWSLLVDKHGEPVNDEDRLALDKLQLAVVEPSKDTLEQFDEFANLAGLFDKSAPNKSQIPLSVLCVIAVAGHVSSWFTLGACVTILGCVVAVGLITSSGAAMADTCSAWANEEISTGPGGDVGGDDGDD